MDATAFTRYIQDFQHNIGEKTRVDYVLIKGKQVPRFSNEFWTSRQRQASSLHEISYRACFKPQLPQFFIEALTEPGDLVYDPFSGRGTTVIEAGLLGRRVVANDINLKRPAGPPQACAPLERIEETGLYLAARQGEMDLLFYHRRTEIVLCAITCDSERPRARGPSRPTDLNGGTNRLSGHQRLFGVYLLKSGGFPRGRPDQHTAQPEPEHKDIVPDSAEVSSLMRP